MWQRGGKERFDFIYIFNFLKCVHSSNNILLSCSFTIVASFSPSYCQLFVTGHMHLLWTFNVVPLSSFSVSPKHYFSIFCIFLQFFLVLLLSSIAKGVCFQFSFYCFCKGIKYIMIIVSECFQNLLKWVLCSAQDLIKNFTLVSSLTS